MDITTLIFFIVLFILIPIVVYVVIEWGKKRAAKDHLPPVRLPTDQFLSISDDIQIRFWQKGRGEDVVLLHGIGASVYIWRFLLEELARNFRVTAIDLPGFGRSSKPKVDYGLDAQSERVLLALEKLEIESFHVVGSSMGGALGLWLAKTHPDQVKSVVAMAPATHSSLVKMPLSLLHSQKNTAGKLFQSRFVQDQVLNKVIYNQNLLTEDNKKIYFEPYSGNDPDSLFAFIDALKIIKDKRLPQQLEGLQQKVFIYHGEHDQMVPIKNMEELHKLLPKSELFIDDRAGHHPMEDHPASVIDKVVPFLKSVR